MTRLITLGNGKLTILYDQGYTLRELYYPLPIDNHLHQAKLGIWSDGDFSWLDQLNPKIDYVENSLSSFAEAEFNGSKIKLVDAIDMAYEIFVREVSVTLPKSSDLRIFFHHDFHVNGNDIGDTALYDPFTSSIIH